VPQFIQSNPVAAAVAADSQDSLRPCEMLEIALIQSPSIACLPVRKYPRYFYFSPLGMIYPVTYVLLVLLISLFFIGPWIP